MRYVEIAKGGTLSKIAKQEGIPLKAILFTNANLDPRRIQIGQKIAIPETEDDLLASAQTHIKKIHKTIDKKPDKEVGNEPKKCEKCEFNWSQTPIVKLIISKESKGSYNAYNVTGWKHGKNKVLESHFSPTSTFNITKMTVHEIQLAQRRHLGPYRKHLFAVGLYQCIPHTLTSFLNWISKYCTISITSQLFDEKFQDKLPWFFWEQKRPIIGKYFRGQALVEEAAYAISKEWASAGTPKGYKIATGKISNGKMSYYGGDGLNKAHYSATKTIGALKKTKMMLEKCGGYNQIKQKQLKGCN